VRGPPGSIVRLTWLAFSLEPHPDCNYDYVDVYDNNTMAYANSNGNASLIGR
jgi:cubilin